MDEATPNKKVSFEDAARDQVKYWQEVLRLQDWNVDLAIVRPHQMTGGVGNSPIAQCDIYERRKDAKMRLLHPMDLPTVAEYFTNGEEQDYDVTMVHELLHLHFQPFAAAGNTTQEVAQEQAIESISRAIVSLYREGHKTHGLPLKEAQNEPSADTDGPGVGHYF